MRNQAPLSKSGRLLLLIGTQSASSYHTRYGPSALSSFVQCKCCRTGTQWRLPSVPRPDMLPKALGKANATHVADIINSVHTKSRASVGYGEILVHYQPRHMQGSTLVVEQINAHAVFADFATNFGSGQQNKVNK